MIVITRSRPLASAEPSFSFSSSSSSACARCSEISFPTSPGDNPSGIRASPEHVTGPLKPIGWTEAGHHPAEVR